MLSIMARLNQIDQWVGTLKYLVRSTGDVDEMDEATKKSALEMIRYIKDYCTKLEASFNK